MIANAALNVFAAIALVAALAMLVVKHPMRVAVSLVVCMLSLAGIYALLGVHVIAVFQVLIYVGAIMVFMVYVIMLIDPRETGFVRFSRYAVPAAIGFAVLVVLLGLALVRGDVAPKGPSGAPFGVQSFSEAFLEEYWLYFELTSVLLVAAVVAAIAVVKIGAKRHG